MFTEKEKTIVRFPAMAGMFYPKESKALSGLIDSFLDNVVTFSDPPKILIVPHAGYQYSGQVAAYGVGQLAKTNVKRVFLLGISHRYSFAGAAVFEKGFWQTPLGSVEIDFKMAAKLVKSNNLLFFDNEKHRDEHSLEVQIPFLQKVLKEFRIVPILLGSENEELIDELSSVLARNFAPQTILVISSDLSHYPSYEQAKQVDQKTIEAILSGKAENLDKAILSSMSLEIPNLVTCACGEAAIKVGMRLANKLKIKETRLLNYSNSGDVAGEKGRVVGYAAIGYY